MGRRKAAAEAEVLLRQEQLSFEAWRDSLETVPTIKVREFLLLGWCSSGFHHAAYCLDLHVIFQPHSKCVMFYA